MVFERFDYVIANLCLFLDRKNGESLLAMHCIKTLREQQQNKNNHGTDFKCDAFLPFGKALITDIRKLPVSADSREKFTEPSLYSYIAHISIPNHPGNNLQT